MKSLPLLSNHPRVGRWTAAVVASVIALGVCLASYDNVDAAIRQNRIERLNARIENVYTADYQNMADDKLEQEKSKSAATEDDMFVTEDPYGTNTTSLYVYFTTDDAVAVSYTCLLYTSDAADEEDSVNFGGGRVIKKKNNNRICLLYKYM